ncbi:MAG: C39 family peptidase [Candidatus Pacebacteria bacterium]|nr:C39 family peptidase [Candidatus Paceibacterota bacterium]
MPRFPVPFYSQHADIERHEWRSRGCGVTSLLMVLAYWKSTDVKNTLPTLRVLLEDGVAIGAYREGVGWIHSGLARLAERFGYTGFNEDFAMQGKTPLSAELAWEGLLKNLHSGPVLASVFSGFDPERGGGHIIVITGYEDGHVYYNDPEEATEERGIRSCSLASFLPAFKRRFIVIRPL